MGQEGNFRGTQAKLITSSQKKNGGESNKKALSLFEIVFYDPVFNYRLLSEEIIFLSWLVQKFLYIEFY